MTCQFNSLVVSTLGFLFLCSCFLGFFISVGVGEGGGFSHHPWTLSHVFLGFSFFMFIHILVRGSGFGLGGMGTMSWNTDFPRYTRTNSVFETLPSNVDHTAIFVTTMVEMLAIQAMICRASLSPLFPGCLIYS